MDTNKSSTGNGRVTEKRLMIFFVGRDSYFLSHRLPTAKAAIELGYDVHVVAADSGLSYEIIRRGMKFHPRWLGQDTIAPLSILAGILQLLFKSLEIRAGIVHVVGLRYSIIGLLISLLLVKVRFVFSINGMGFLFLQYTNSLQHKIARKTLMLLFTSVGTLRAIDVIFQNDDDKQKFLEFAKIRKANIHLVRGSGVDITRYPPSSMPPGKVIVFGMACRMIKMKGVLDIANAFKQLIDEGFNLHLKLAGKADSSNPDSLTPEEIMSICQNSRIEWLGYLDEISKFWDGCHIAVLGSHGGEGLPMSLLIPAAMGRPIICSNTNGNRDLVDEGKNGYLFSPGDVASIKRAILTILSDDLNEMGKASRQLIIERAMDANAVHKQFLKIYRP